MAGTPGIADDHGRTAQRDTTTFVLVPGAGGQGWYWHGLQAVLGERGYRSIAVDLPANDDELGLDAYADLVVDATAGLDRVVLVGQSMGCLSAPLVAARRSVELLVLINPMIPTPGESGGDWWAATGQPQARAALAAAEGRAVTDDVDLLEDFFHDVSAEVTAEALQHPSPQSGRPFADPFPLPRWPDVPTRVLVGRDDRFFPLDFQRRQVADRLGGTPEVMPGGHLLALSQPVALADKLIGWAEEITAEDLLTPGVGPGS